MAKVKGIKSVDFKITARGHGVVNWNGSTKLFLASEGKEVENHTLPKLRGYTNLSGKTKTNEDGSVYHYKKEATDIDFGKNPMYVSQNCVRHHLFKDQAFDVNLATGKELNKLLASETGLLRGYVLTSTRPLKRTSPLLLEDFVDQLGNGNFEQMGRSGIDKEVKETDEKGKKVGSTSIFSKTTFGETEYVAYGSINVENLQFISLDGKFDRRAFEVSKKEAPTLAKEIEDFIRSIDDLGRSPTVVFHSNYVRVGAIYKEGEAGFLLNDDAQEILIDEMLRRVKELAIKQAKGYLYVDEVAVDYNASHKMMRIKRHPEEIEPMKTEPFATYFVGEEL